MTLHVDDISVSFGSVSVLRSVSLVVDQGERVAIMGPSGTGKSTLLRSIAGLIHPDTGSIRLDGQDITTSPPHTRKIGLMFQHYALFPHMSVIDNVAYGLRMHGADASAARRRAGELLAIVGLADLADRNPSSLSGGEQQRVALARTLAPSPRVVLLDEPMGSVDNALKDSLMISTIGAIDSVGAAAIYVTHDRLEAERFADTIGIMRGGSIVRWGSAEDIWHDPQTEFVADFIGHDNILDVDGPTLGRVLGPSAAPGRKGVVPIAALQVGLEHRDGHGIEVEGTVASSVFTDGVYRIAVATSDDERIIVESDKRVGQGDQITVTLNPEAVRLVAADEL